MTASENGSPAEGRVELLADISNRKRATFPVHARWAVDKSFLTSADIKPSNPKTIDTLLSRILDETKARHDAQLSDEEHAALRRQIESAVSEFIDPTPGESNTAPADSSNIQFNDPTPLNEEVDGCKVLQEIRGYFRDHCIMSDGVDLVVALWIFHTWVFEIFYITPRLIITGPTMRCGKSRFMSLIAPLCRRAKKAERITKAAVVRIAGLSPTLCLDEGDTYLRDRDEDGIFGVINSGYARDGNVILCVPSDDGFVPAEFSTFMPLCIAMIKLPNSGTLIDRSIVISMTRKKVGEKVQRLMEHKAQSRGELFCRQLVTWINQNREKLDELAMREEDPWSVAGADDRTQDNWRALLIIAETLGDDVLQDALKVASGVTKAREKLADPEESIELLGHLFDVFRHAKKAQTGVAKLRLTSEGVCMSLNDNQAIDYRLQNYKDGVTQKWLASQLKPFEIQPKNVKIAGKVKRGFKAEEMDEVFVRYLGLSIHDDPPAEDDEEEIPE